MPDAPDDRPPARRRTPDGRLEVGPTWESLVERQIREAIEAGEFDELPHRGEPLPDDTNPYAGDLGLAFHVLRNAGIAPPWIEADKEVRSALAERDALLERARRRGRSPFSTRRDRAALAALVERANGAIARLNAEAPTDRQRRLPLDLAAELARYDEATGA